MYRINRLHRNVLVTPDEVIFHAATDNEIDERQVLNNIIVAEERFIANSLGDSFYEDFISKKNVKVDVNNQADLLTKINASLVLSGGYAISATDIPIGTIINSIELVDNEWYVKLWDRFLWKLTAECVDMMTIVPSWLRHTSIGQQLNNPNTLGGNGASSASGNQKDVQFKINIFLQDRIDPLTERMRLWICQNKEHFELYTKDCGGDCNHNGTAPDGVSHIRKTNFITNLYND
jgi:hypothetical protein